MYKKYVHFVHKCVICIRSIDICTMYIAHCTQSIVSFQTVFLFSHICNECSEGGRHINKYVFYRTWNFRLSKIVPKPTKVITNEFFKTLVFSILSSLIYDYLHQKNLHPECFQFIWHDDMHNARYAWTQFFICILCGVNLLRVLRML